MNKITLCLFAIFTLLQLLILKSHASPQRVVKRGSGKYVANNSERKLEFSNFSPEQSTQGKYTPDHDRWAYKHDNSGKYVHVHIPYDGGYGPFKNPYEHDGRPYEHDDRKYKDVFDVQVFTDKTPSVYREYGAPLFNSRFS